MLTFLHHLGILCSQKERLLRPLSGSATSSQQSKAQMKKHSFALSFAALCVLAGTHVGFCVTLNGVDVPKDKLICYLFIGHSNMQGYGGIPDTVPDPRVWAYNDTLGFWNARDPVETSYYSPSPFMPFLKKMAALYPDYYFCGIKVTQAGMSMSSQFLRTMPKYTEIMQTVAAIKDSVTIGGIIAMFGWVEGSSDSLSQRFDVDVNTMLTSFRQDLGIPNLPMIMGRYEMNSDTTIYASFYAYRNRIIAKLELLQSEDSLQHRIMLTPFLPIPKTMYFDSHHYNADGYSIWSTTAAEILQSSNWNAWYPLRSAPLKMLFPSGGEVFAYTDSIPITWMCDPESLSVIFINLSRDSGKTWSLISGDQALYPWIKTFYWTPSKSGLTFTNNGNLMIEIDDYDGKHSCRSNTFFLDSVSTRVRVPKALPARVSPVTVRPGKTAIEVKMGAQGIDRSVCIYSMQGRCLVRCTVEKTSDCVDIPSACLTSGTYLLTLSPPSASMPQRGVTFVLQK